MLSHFVSYKQLNNKDFEIACRWNNHEYFPQYHYHDFYEIQIYTCDDESKDVIGQILLNDETLDLHNNDLVSIAMFDSHCYIPIPDIPYRRYCISIDPHVLYSLNTPNTNILEIFSKSNSNYPLVQIDDDMRKTIMNIITKLNEDTYQPGNDVFQKGMLSVLCALIYRAFYSGNSYHHTEAEHIEKITKLTNYVNNHLADDLDLDTLSEISGYSIYHLCRVFKNHTGDTINHYILSKRIEQAKILLEADFLTADVCNKVGFKTYSHFYRAFKKAVGMNPTEYRDSVLITSIAQTKQSDA